MQEGRRDDVRSNLVLLEGLLDLLEVGEQADWNVPEGESGVSVARSACRASEGGLRGGRTVGRNLVGGRAERGERAKDIAVDLARVRLAGDGVGVREAEELSHALVEGLDLLVVAVKQGEERGLRSGRALDATEAEVVLCPPEVAQIPQELLEPERRALADRRQLGRLEVGEAERRQRAVLLGKGSEARDDGRELVEQEREAVAQEDEVGVAAERSATGRVAGRSARATDCSRLARQGERKNALGDEARGGTQAGEEQSKRERGQRLERARAQPRAAASPDVSEARRATRNDDDALDDAGRGGGDETKRVDVGPVNRAAHGRGPVKGSSACAR